MKYAACSIYKITPKSLEHMNIHTTEAEKYDVRYMEINLYWLYIYIGIV